jgi:hypothetical protein
LPAVKTIERPMMIPSSFPWLRALSESAMLRPAMTMAATPRAGDSFRMAYRTLEPLRRRALFTDRYCEIHPTLESEVLLRVGLYAAASWQQRGCDPSSAARALFLWIFEQARRLWLIDTLDIDRTRTQLVTCCFAFMPYLFGDALGDTLKDVVPYLANDARVLAGTAASLRANGIDATKVRAMITDANADLDEALRDAHEWSELTGRKETFPDSLTELAEALAIDLAQVGEGAKNES